MTREELAERVNELLIERATSETKTALHEKAMALIDLYVESREIPPPPLKWVDQEDHISARMFDKLRFSVYARYGGKFEALYMGYPIDHLEHPFQSDAIKACEAKWKEIWEKEMSH
jgi:hypothetical protein